MANYGDTNGGREPSEYQASVEWDGDYWRVVDARFDDAPTGGHWHVTLTGPLQGEQLRDAMTAAEIRQYAAHARRNPRQP